MMEISVRLFASAREIAGMDETTLALAEQATLEDLQAALYQRHPRLKDLRLRFAVNARYAPDQTTLESGDEVACIPPVGGG